MRVWSGRGKVLGKSHSIFKGIFEQKRRKRAKRAVPTPHFRTAWSSTVSRCSPYDALTQFPIWHEKAAAKCMLRGGLCVQRMERGSAGSPRQVPLRSLTAFFLDRFAIGGTLGDFIPQTPSLGTSPQTPFLASRGFKPFLRCPRRRSSRWPCQRARAGCRSSTGAPAYPPGNRRCQTPRW